MSQTQNPLFEGTIPTTTTKYVPIPVHRRAIGCTIGWLDAVSAATITLELTDAPHQDVGAEEAGDAWQWLDSGETIVGPSASAAGGTLVQIENCNHRRGRLKIVTTAICDFKIDGFGGEGY